MAGRETAADEPHLRVHRFLANCQRRLDRVADSGEARAGGAALAAAIDRAEPRPYEPTWLPALDSIDRLLDQRTEGETVDPLVEELVTLAPDLPWTPTHRATDGGTSLALAPLDRVFDLGDTIVGLMYVGPEATYPLHHHPPQELYLTIGGRGRWRYGGHEHHETIGPRQTLYNRPGDLHSATAGPQPVAALYVLW